MIKKKLAKVLAVIMTASLALGAVGCGSSADSKEITINFPSIWVGKDSKAKVMSELINEFNEDNKGEIKVVVEEIANYDDYEKKMKTNIAANTVPDVFIFKAGTIAEQYFKSGKLMDFTSYMNDGWKNDFIESAVQDVTYEDKVLAVPYEFGVTPVMYNGKMLEEVGYKEFPKTYTEFFEMCDKLKEKGIAPLSQMTGANAWTSMLWYSQLVTSIGGPDVYKRGLDDPAFLEAAKVMKKMFDYTTSDAVGAEASVAAGHFLNERTAMLMNGPWFIGRVKTEGINNMYDNVNIAPAPYFEGGKGAEGGYIGFIQADIAAAKQEDKAKEEAVIKFLKHLTNPENVKRLSMDSGSMFVVKTEFKDGDNIEKLQGQMIEQTNSAPYVAPHFNMSVKPAVATEFPQALSALVLGDMTPEEFIEDLKAAEAR